MVADTIDNMALRSPMYLDLDTLLAQAEYHDVEVPRQSEVVEKTTRKQSAGGNVGTHGVGVRGSRGTDVEVQESYRLAPRAQATVSKVIDALIREEVVTTKLAEATLKRDDLIEVEGLTHITPASLAGKMFYIFKRLMNDADLDLETIVDLEVEDLPLAEQIKAVYLGNELLPIPILLELAGSGGEQRVYVNLRPDHFVDSASADRIEGHLRVLGTVSQLVEGSADGYLSAEYWLLNGWEHLTRRVLMTQVEDVVKSLVGEFSLDLPADDVHAFITGPAVVIDAIAVY